MSRPASVNIREEVLADLERVDIENNWKTLWFSDCGVGERSPRRVDFRAAATVWLAVLLWERPLRYLRSSATHSHQLRSSATAEYLDVYRRRSAYEERYWKLDKSNKPSELKFYFSYWCTITESLLSSM
jgi:hypothetical protein